MESASRASLAPLASFPEASWMAGEASSRASLASFLEASWDGGGECTPSRARRFLLQKQQACNFFMVINIINDIINFFLVSKSQQGYEEHTERRLPNSTSQTRSNPVLHVIEADRSMSSLKDTGASPGTSDTSECPICREHAPTSQLSSSGNFAPNGVWMGPHCAACEREMSQQARQNQPPTPSASRATGTAASRAPAAAPVVFAVDLRIVHDEATGAVHVVSVLLVPVAAPAYHTAAGR